MRYSFLLILIMVLACHEKNNNKVSPAELVKSREIKKVSEAEILSGATKLAEDLLRNIDSIVIQRLNLENPDCEVINWPELDSLGKEADSEIRLVENGSKNIRSLEYQLLEAYQYNLENDLVLKPSVQKLDERTVLYTSPIKSGTALFDTCFDSTSQQTVKMWSLKIPFKGVIQRL